MKKFQVFISSVQAEFEKERLHLAEYFRSDPLLGQFFEPFIFEEVPATTHHPGKVYLIEVERSDVYVGLLGKNYGYDSDTDYVTDHVTDHVERDAPTSIGLHQIDILTERLIFILDNEMTRQELMDCLELKHLPNFRDNYLEPALREGWIEMTIPDKPKSIKQKYRLTSKGVEFKNKLMNRQL